MSTICERQPTTTTSNKSDNSIKANDIKITSTHFSATTVDGIINEIGQNLSQQNTNTSINSNEIITNNLTVSSTINTLNFISNTATILNLTTSNFISNTITVENLYAAGFISNTATILNFISNTATITNLTTSNFISNTITVENLYAAGFISNTITVENLYATNLLSEINLVVSSTDTYPFLKLEKFGANAGWVKIIYNPVSETVEYVFS